MNECFLMVKEVLLLFGFFGFFNFGLLGIMRRKFFRILVFESWRSVVSIFLVFKGGVWY